MENDEELKRLEQSIEEIVREKYTTDPVSVVSKAAPIVTSIVAVITVISGIVIQFFSLERQLGDVTLRISTMSEKLVTIEKKISDMDIQGTRHSSLVEATIGEVIKNIQADIAEQAANQKQLAEFLRKHDEEMRTVIMERRK